MSATREDESMLMNWHRHVHARREVVALSEGKNPRPDRSYPSITPFTSATKVTLGLNPHSQVEVITGCMGEKGLGVKTQQHFKDLN